MKLNMMTLVLIFSANVFAQMNMTVVTSENAILRSAHNRYQAKNDVLPFCAEGYLGGGHKGKSQYKPLQVSEVSSHVYRVTGKTSAPVSLACNYQYRSSHLEIEAKDQRPCQYMEQDTSTCVWPAGVSFDPKADQNAQINIACEIVESGNFRRLECQRN